MNIRTLFRSFAGGKIAEAWVSWDTLSLVEQLTEPGEEPGSGFLHFLERLRVRA